MKCTKCGYNLEKVRSEKEPIKRDDGVVTFRDLEVYRCNNPECSNNEDIKVPAQ